MQNTLIVLFFLTTLWIASMAFPRSGIENYDNIAYSKGNPTEEKEVIAKSYIANENKNDDDEIMVTAHRVVYTPLFRYKKRLTKRTRYGNTRRYNGNRRYVYY